MKIEVVDLMELRYVKYKLINKFLVNVVFNWMYKGIVFICSLNINNNV